MKIGTVASLPDVPCVVVDAGEYLRDADYIFAHARQHDIVDTSGDREKLIVLFVEARLKGKAFTRDELQTRLDQIQAGRDAVKKEGTKEER